MGLKVCKQIMIYFYYAFNEYIINRLYNMWNHIHDNFV